MIKACSGDSGMWREWRVIGIAKRVYVGVCAGSRSVGRPWKRWIDTFSEYLRKRGLDVRQARRMKQDRSACQMFVRRNEWGKVWRMNP